MKQISLEDMNLTDKEMEDFHNGSKLLFGVPEPPKKKVKKSRNNLTEL